METTAEPANLACAAGCWTRGNTLLVTAACCLGLLIYIYASYILHVHVYLICYLYLYLYLYILYLMQLRMWRYTHSGQCGIVDSVDGG
jgi:hypothetical protein